MLVYRICMNKFATGLFASGRAARWNSNDIKMVYTASSRSLACLENVVHRSQAGLSQLFSVLTINCPETVKIKTIAIADLPPNWTEYEQMAITQKIGDDWIKDNSSAILRVPSSIIEEEFNYLLNPEHDDFKKIKLLKSIPFIFDKRIKE